MTTTNHPLGALVLRVGAAALSFGLSVIAARVLGIENFGFFNVFIAFINVGVVFALLGHETLATRMVAILGAAPNVTNRKELSNYVDVAARQVGLMSLGIVLAITVLLWSLPIGRSAPYEMWLLIPLVFFIARTRLSQGIIRGAHHASLAIVPDGIVRPCFALLGLAGMLFVGVRTTSLLILFMLGSASVAYACGKRLETKVLAGIVDPNRSLASGRESNRTLPARFSKSIFASSILAVFTSQMAVIATGNLADPEQAGLYAAAERFALAASLIGQAVYQAVASRIAALFIEGNMVSMRILVRRITRNVFISTALLCIVMGFTAEMLLALYGNGFESARVVLKVLILTVMVNVGAGPVGILLLMTNNANLHLIALSASVAAQLILYPLVIPQYGMLGAAWVVFVSTLVWNGLMAQFVHRKLDMNRFLVWA